MRVLTKFFSVHDLADVLVGKSRALRLLHNLKDLPFHKLSKQLTESAGRLPGQTSHENHLAVSKPNQFCTWPRQKRPNSNLQAPKKHQAPSSKTELRVVCHGICFGGLGFEIWNFSGALALVLGVSLGAGRVQGDGECAQNIRSCFYTSPLTAAPCVLPGSCFCHRRVTPCPVSGVPWPFALPSGRGRTLGPSR